jgi:heterodisulfide reductase subunit D
MENINVILFLCNWSPHAAFQQLQEVDYQIPAEIRMIRIPCTGRITKALLFKAFEMGADGVALVGCGSGTCRYGSGTQAAISNTEDTRNIIELIGLGKDRMRLATFLPHESQPLREFLAGFCKDIRAMGKSPITPSITREQIPFDDSVGEIVAKHDAFSCQDCGKCTSSCPLALCGKPYSPRDIVSGIIHGEIISQQVENDINACLTCGICHERCPSDVNFPEFIRDMRCSIGSNGGNGTGRQAHGGFFQSLMRAMVSPDLKPNRWRNLPEQFQTDPDSKIMFFGGCAPYFDVFFKRHHHVKTMDILSDSLRLLNFFDVHPRLFNEERCCGHDLLWSGDRANFIRLAKLNVEAIRDAGIETVITSCPECYKTIRFDYEKHGIDPGFDVIHLYEFLETEIDKGAVEFNHLSKKITFQDSCRLNRLESLRNFPRKLIHRLSVEKFEEMKDSDRSALCCGNCAWTGCDAYSKALQVKRLRQAHATGSDLMVTSCPKCQIHLSCAMQDTILGDELNMEMIDLTSIIANTICWE